LLGYFGKLFIEFFEGLTDETGITCCGHEVGITVPAGDQVQMNMVGQAGAGAAADIDSNVVTMGMDGLVEDFLGVTREEHKI